jgi:hypothetical protein
MFLSFPLQETETKAPISKISDTDNIKYQDYCHTRKHWKHSTWYVAPFYNLQFAIFIFKF